MFHDPLVVRACILPKESMGEGMSCLVSYWLRVSGFSEGSAILQRLGTCTDPLNYLESEFRFWFESRTYQVTISDFGCSKISPLVRVQYGTWFL